MENTRRSPERLEILPEFYLCWCFIALICGILLTNLLSDMVIPLWWLSGIIGAGLFWVAGRFSHHGLVSLYAMIFSGWLMLGVAAASLETMLHPPDNLFSKAHSGVYTLSVQKIDKRKPDSIRLEGNIIKNKETDPAFTNLSNVRVTLYRSGNEITEGDELTVYGRLFPLSGSVFANSPDFSRQLRLRDIGATGIAYKVISHRHHPPKTVLSKLGHYRHQLAENILAQMETEQGAIASAMLVGVRDYVQNDIYDTFRKAGLAHLLAISGLHMGIFCIFIFSLIRSGLALMPDFAMRFPVHKFAAIFALLASLFYLFLTGFPVSAIRAFLMSGLVIIAILSDRLALTYRNLAMVGIIIVLCYPSALYTASFQLSFSATFALVTAVQITGGHIGHIPFVRGFLFLSFSSALITIFSLPFAIWHFATISLWGVVSNILAIPLTGVIIMPAGVLMLVCLIMGLPAFGATVMEVSLSLLLTITQFFASLPGASIYLNPPEQLFLLGWTICVLAILSVRQRWRYLGIGLFMMLVVIWVMLPQSDAGMFHNGKKAVFAISHHNRLIASSALSQFWQFQLYRHLGSEEVELMPCEQGVCSVDVEGRHIGFIEIPIGLTEGCKQPFDALISPYAPRYPCKRPHLLIVEEDSNILIRITDDGFAIRP